MSQDGQTRTTTTLVAPREFGPFDELSDIAHARHISGFSEDAVRMCRQWRALTVAAGDETTTRYLQYVEGLALKELGRHDEAVAVARELLAELPGAGDTDDAIWRAKALSIVAQGSTRLGDHVEATRALAEAEWLVRDVPVGSYGHLSASMAVGLTLRSVDLLEQADVVLGAIRGGGSREVDLHVMQELAVLSAYWACLLRLIGRDDEAAAQDALTYSRGLHMQRVARETGNEQMRARGEVVEAFATLWLGDPRLAVARARDAAERFAARPELVESGLLHFVLARGEAAEGRYDAARTHLRAQVADAETSARDVWASVGRAALADLDVEQHGDHEGMCLWRSVARSAFERLWSEREARFAALQDRHHVRELRAETRRIGAAVRTDPLTGLGNRRMLDDLTDTTTVGAAVFIDVDDFKDINDSYSHAVGDDALRAVARILRAESRSVDQVIRYGGDEFVVLTAEGAEGAERLAARIHGAVRGAPWDDVAEGLRITVSVGVGVVGPESPDALAAADAALLAAKRDGRDRVVVGV